jgi:hypothetical protein
MVNKTLILAENCLAVFVDDTGHEALVAGHPVYGLGGCAVMGRDLGAVVQAPWREVRRRVTGSSDTPLHANTFAGFASKENIAIVSEFFRRQPFRRLGAIVSFKTAFPDELGALPTIAKVLQLRIADIARWTAFDSIAVIFESSQRADPMIEAAFQDFALEEDGKSIRIDCYFMPKSAGEPALEVADFIVHSVGRQARQNLSERGIFVPDFKAVFHSVDRKRVSFMEVSNIAVNA